MVCSRADLAARWRGAAHRLAASARVAHGRAAPPRAGDRGVRSRSARDRRDEPAALRHSAQYPHALPCRGEEPRVAVRLLSARWLPRSRLLPRLPRRPVVLLRGACHSVPRGGALRAWRDARVARCTAHCTICTACRLPSHLPCCCDQSAGGAAAAGLPVHRVAGLPHAFGTQRASRAAVVGWLTTTVRKLRGGGGARGDAGVAPGARIAASRRASRSPART